MYCPNCKAWNQDHLQECVFCGMKLPVGDWKKDRAFCKDGVIKLRDLFSSVWDKHTMADTELYLTEGTPLVYTESMSRSMSIPKPWLFARVLLLSLVAYLGFYAGLFFFDNINFLPGLIIIGAVITPVSLLIFFWEINLPRNISIFKLTLFVLEGGLAALLYTVTIYTLIDGNQSPLIVGFVEEAAKAFALLHLLHQKRYPSILNGLLIGAAVGTGFAAIETSGYVLTSALTHGVPEMLKTIYWRALLAPGGHIAWAGLMGAELMSLKSQKPKRLPDALRPRFIGMYLLVVLLHAFWDADLPQLFLKNLPLYPILLTFLSWFLLFAMMKRGFRQTVCDGTEHADPHPQ